MLPDGFQMLEEAAGFCGPKERVADLLVAAAAAMADVDGAAEQPADHSWEVGRTVPFQVRKRFACFAPGRHSAARIKSTSCVEHCGLSLDYVRPRGPENACSCLHHWAPNILRFYDVEGIAVVENGGRLQALAGLLQPCNPSRACKTPCPR